MPDLIAEARVLGLVVGSALSALGEGLRTGNAEAAAREMLAGGVDRAVAQADLTIVCAGRPARALRLDLDLLADSESRSGASTWRVSEQSLRRACDRGWDGQQILAALHRWLGDDLPQPLSYLVDDAARRYGRLRVRAATAVVHADDPALIADVLGHRALRDLGLTRLTNTVVVSSEPAETVLAALRSAGFTPGAETVSGVAKVTKGKKAKRADPPPRALQHLHEPVPIEALVKALLAT